MTAIEDHVEGSARTLILNEMNKMNELADNSDRKSSEEAYVE